MKINDDLISKIRNNILNKELTIIFDGVNNNKNKESLISMSDREYLYINKNNLDILFDLLKYKSTGIYDNQCLNDCYNNYNYDTFEILNIDFSDCLSLKSNDIEKLVDTFNSYQYDINNPNYKGKSNFSCYMKLAFIKFCNSNIYNIDSIQLKGLFTLTNLTKLHIGYESINYYFMKILADSIKNNASIKELVLHNSYNVITSNGFIDILNSSQCLESIVLTDINSYKYTKHGKFNVREKMYLEESEEPGFQENLKKDKYYFKDSFNNMKLKNLTFLQISQCYVSFYLLKMILELLLDDNNTHEHLISYLNLDYLDITSHSKALIIEFLEKNTKIKTISLEGFICYNTNRKLLNKIKNKKRKCVSISTSNLIIIKDV